MFFMTGTMQFLLYHLIILIMKVHDIVVMLAAYRFDLYVDHRGGGGGGEGGDC